MAVRNQVLSELRWGQGEKIIKTLGDAINDAGGNTEHFTRVLSEPDLTKQLAELLVPSVQYRSESGKFGFHLTRNIGRFLEDDDVFHVPAKLMPKHRQDRFESGIYDWGYDWSAPGRQVEGRLLQPRTSGMSQADFHEEVLRLGCGVVTPHELLAFGHGWHEWLKKRLPGSSVFAFRHGETSPFLYSIGPNQPITVGVTSLETAIQAGNPRFYFLVRSR